MGSKPLLMATSTQHKDVFLIIVIVVVLMMMIVPVPTVLMDILIALNIAAAILVMLLVLQLRKSVDFTTFPSVLLVTTLFRLAISISTTRLILIDGDAGKIVQTFGEVVVQGNLVVGLVIFMIITVVQFLVITKGADRVAEVGARFTLDGLPGKQMSVDADVRAGNIDQQEAQAARGVLEQETKLFGAMDGAMKFVKGDAIAGLVITAINLIGGIAIGMAQLGYTFSDALGLYALMTIGDGLVAQIPALLISVAAGTMVTRVTNPKGTDLATEISQQVSANRRTMILGGLVIAIFGLIPGFPTLTFFIIGLSMSGIVYWRFRNSEKNKAKDYRTDWKLLLARNMGIVEEHVKKTGSAPNIQIALPQFALLVDPNDYYQKLLETKVEATQELGFDTGVWGFYVGNSQDLLTISVKGEIEISERLRPDSVFVKANASYLEALSIPVATHFGAREGCYVAVEHMEALRAAEVPYLDLTQQIMQKLKEVLTKQSANFINLQETESLLTLVGMSNKPLERSIKEELRLGQILSILRLLMEEQIPIKQLSRIMEAILEWAPKIADPHLVLQQVRVGIGDFISGLFTKDNLLPVVAVAPSLESLLREGIRVGEEQQYLVLDGALSKSITAQVRALLPKNHQRGVDPVLVTQQDVRRAMYNLLKRNGIDVPVLCYQEIPPDVMIYPVSFIAPDHPE